MQWIDKFKSMPTAAKPYVFELAVAVCKNCGVPGGGLLGDVLDGIDRVDQQQDQQKIDDLLGVIFGQGGRSSPRWSSRRPRRARPAGR